MSVKKRGLGRGLESLLSSVSAPADDNAGESLRELALDSLHPGRHQPRRHFDDEALQALAESIRSQGVVQPIVARPSGAHKYEIVAGERRWRAAKLAGLNTVPVVVRTLDERGAMAVALVENIQRADLNPLEEAEALHKLIEDCGLTHEKAAEAVGRSRAHISNLLRLIELNADVQKLVREGRLSLGHAKVLLGIHGPRQSALAKLVAEQQMSVRQTEALVHAEGRPAAPRANKPRAPALEKEISARIGLPVRLHQAESGRGKLTVSFRSAEELQKLLGRLG
ncbi:ParB/RepB/Spo0J family partition protein [Fontimonas sp. SYSU GA230001]|uniref:ParB/RepB/Spo0J family partition protein n=1 Tax=Fontimonas sp. SYSU GA230001 TaxID=3142450 RepID=UPI0032B3B466